MKTLNSQGAEDSKATEQPADLVDLKAASEAAKTTKQSIEWWVRSKKLPSYAGANGARLVSLGELLAFQEAKKHEGNAGRTPTTGTQEKNPSKPEIQEESGGDPLVSQGGVVKSEPAPASTETASVTEQAGVSGPSVESRENVLPPASSDGSPKLQMVEISSICLEKSIQVREREDEEVVKDYAEKLDAGVELPPIVLFYDGSMLLIADGFHRLAAAKLNGNTQIPAYLHAGGRSAAVRHALQANVTHGLRLTSADKRRKVALALAEYPALSDAQIAEICAVSGSLVRTFRISFVKNGPATRIGKDGKNHPVKKRSQHKQDDNQKEKSLFKKTATQVRKLGLESLRNLQEVIAEQLAKLQEEPPAQAA
jgi:hypothetical protein